MSELSAADAAWVLVSAALVMLMTPAVGFFYGGLVRRKNVLSIMMQSLVVLALISVQWVLWGYSLAFGPDRGGIIGGLVWAGLSGVGPGPLPAEYPSQTIAATYRGTRSLNRNHAAGAALRAWILRTP